MLLPDQAAAPITRAPRVRVRDCETCHGTGAVVLVAIEGETLGARETCSDCRGRGRIWEPR